MKNTNVDLENQKKKVSGEQKVPKEQQIPFKKLFQYATKKDKFFIVLGSIASLCNGVLNPVMAIILGNIATDYQDTNNLIKTGGRYAGILLGLGAGSLILSYISYACWAIVGENQSLRIRKEYFKSLIKQEISFFDKVNPNELATRVQNQCFDIQQGISDKVFSFFNAFSMGFAGFLIGYIKGWQLALCMTAIVPFMAGAAGAFVVAFQSVQRVSNEAYSQSGAISEEALNAVRTVTALCGQERIQSKYHKLLEEAKKKVLKFFVFMGISIGFLQFAINALHSFAFYIGSLFIDNDVNNPVVDRNYNVGDILTVFISVLMGMMSISQLAPALKAFGSAREAGTKAFKIIEKPSEISIDDPRGIKPSQVTGEFTFEKVEFSYPLKKDKKILKGISFTIKRNQKTAFVGESGCGKTTSMQLIERFYDIDSGSIKLDGNDLREINLFWLRSQIGYVGQEPVLFATSIRENLLLAKDHASDAEIWEALKKANADEFVRNLPDKLDTFVGNSGTQLSGGQKQRLAIARAILKNPPILLLDEATSALDRKNEVEIQKTLDEISGGRTTIVIAHRLSTIINADHIVVFDKGEIVEEGTHAELIAKKGKYYDLQKLQLAQEEEKEKKPENSNEANSSDSDKENASKATQVKLTKKESLVNPDTLEQSTKEQTKNNIQSTESTLKLMRKLFAMNKKNLILVFIGSLGSAVNGVTMPLGSIFIAELLFILSAPDSPDYRSEVNKYCLYFFFNAIAAWIGDCLSLICFTRFSESLGVELRTTFFRKLMRMNIGWHDRPENGPGGLVTKLNTDCEKINILVGTSITVIVKSSAMLITALVISLTASWEIALCIIPLLPIQIYSGKIQAEIAQGMSKSDDSAYKESGSFVSEAVVNMRTVASFGKEDKLIASYEKKLQGPVSQAIKKGNKSGLAFGFSQFTIFIVNAFTFFISAVFLKNERATYPDMFKCMLSIMFAAMGVGQNFQILPDVGSAINSARGIFGLLEQKPEIDIDDSSQTVTTPIKGNIIFKNIWFRYPTREKYVLKNFSLTININSKVALVGPSGCGKSTLIALLLRFYNPEKGEITVDGIDIKKYNLTHLRRSFGYVSQEPTLFNDTIEENIRFTKPDATEEEIRKAAAESNSLKFIEANQFEALEADPNAAMKYGVGFQRVVGSKGSQISGGQKQRIAIARAILPKPSVLLLDEATSALDAENEKIVQASLDELMRGKTSIIVAHRISTIRDADQILVFYDGAVVERGTYKELNDLQGFFYKLERGIAL